MTKIETAFALHQRGQLDQAEILYKEILQSQPRHFDALQLLATIATQRKNSALAVELFDRALEIEPNHPMVLNNRGAALRDLKRPIEALASLDKALKIVPDYAEAHLNRGAALRDLKRPDEALNSFDKAIAIKPDFAQAFINRANALRDLKHPKQALESLNQALAIQPDFAEAHWIQGLCYLSMGEFILGWQKYEWRWKMKSQINNQRGFTQPLWLGNENLENKTILLYAEQGLGDTIQFCRYALQVAELGARVILEVQSSLKPLLKGLPGVATLLARGENLPDFDFYCPLLSLAYAFGTDLSTIQGSSYIKADGKKIEEWNSILNRGLKIGLAWSGNEAHENDHNRSIPLVEFKDLMDDRSHYYCLQKDLKFEDKAVLSEIPSILFFGNELNDFTDTAALIELMDLVITVDTSIAHLAGAMGKEVWILLPFNPDWRWLLDRNNSPWYSSARLFRQPSFADWNSVISDIKAALKE